MKPIRDRKYLAFVRSHSCCACSSWRQVEAAHTGMRGLGQKADDSTAIPLCLRCHRTATVSYHALGRIRFAERFQLDIPAIIRELTLEWAGQQQPTPELGIRLVMR